MSHGLLRGIDSAFAAAARAGDETAPTGRMILHTVYFWLKPGLLEEERQDFLDGLRRLVLSPNVYSCRVGTPVRPARPDADASFDFQAVIEFPSAQDYAAYQSPGDRVHTMFVLENQHRWSRLRICDAAAAQG